MKRYLKKKIREENYFLEEIEQNKLMHEKHKKVCIITLSYIEHVLILVSKITRCISISVFVSLFGV